MPQQEQLGGRSLTDVVTTIQRRDHYRREGFWDGSTLVDTVCRWAKERPDALAVVDAPDSAGHSYAELVRHAFAAAGRLHELGVRPGDVVTVQLPNWYETVAIDLGVHILGAVLNPVLPIYRERELSNIVSTAGTRVIVSPSTYRRHDYVAMIESVTADHPGLVHLVVDRGDAQTIFADWPTLTERPVLDPADVSELIFSSGTESAPKAIMHTEQTLCAGTRSATAEIGIGEGDRVWMPSPIGHSTGLNYGVRVALFNGLPLTLQDKWDPVEALALIKSFRPSYTLTATTFLTDLLDAAQSTGADISSLRLFSCGGAPVSKADVHRARELGVTVLRLYGSTEVLIGSWNRPDSPLAKRDSTDGKPFAGTDLQVRDEAGTVLVGEPGELFVRGPNCSVGFFDDPERTRATYSIDGWIRSGDLGVLDADGYFTMSGRKKEIIIRGGLNITPREIEDVIAAMPHVHEVAVVGLPDDRLGETTCACVVTDGVGLSLQEVVTFLREQGMAPFKLPERLAVLDALPRTPSGKVQKFQLVRMMTGTDTGRSNA
jgi:acyl-CoA synthetase (AMP-forming)/AMP-acid ligase II